MTYRETLEQELLDMERKALARWVSGDPSGFLEISAPDVVYFDPYRERRVDGLEALTRIYEELRGKISAARFEILNPCVQQVGAAAVLTFNFASYGGRRAQGQADEPGPERAGGLGGPASRPPQQDEDALRWNCTEVYRRDPAGWRIIQTHWSYTWPPPKGYAS